MDREMIPLLIECLCVIHGEGILYSSENNQKLVESLIFKYKQEIINYIETQGSDYIYLKDFLREWRR